MFVELDDAHVPMLESAARAKGFSDLESFIQAFLTNAARRYKLEVEAKAAEARIAQEPAPDFVKRKVKKDVLG